MHRHRQLLCTLLFLLALSLSQRLFSQNQWPKCDALLRCQLIMGENHTRLPVRVWQNSGIQNHISATKDEIMHWHQRTDVRYLERVHLLSPLLDVSLPAIGADRVHADGVSQGYTGQGVLIAIIDSGIDWRHADFIDDDGKTRILAIWDQTDNSGLPPEGYDYGTLFSRAMIQAAIDGTGPDVQGKDLWGHGTHIAGIAAGNGRATGNGLADRRYVGVAPEAELLIVKGGNRQFFENQVLDGLRFCFDRGDRESKPVVANLSVGSTHFGPHDGSSFFEASIDEMLWSPSRAVVIAAGNNGTEALHFKGQTTSVNDVVIEFTVTDNQEGTHDFIGFDIWSDVWSSLLKITIITPSGERLGPVLPGAPVQQWDHAQGRIYLDHASTGINEANQCYHTLLRLSDAEQGQSVVDNLAPGTWALQFIGATSAFDGWLYEHSLPVTLTQGGDYSAQLPEPANGYFPITVGAFVTRSTWPSLGVDPHFDLQVGTISTFSSAGPTRDGRQKPDLCAPGEHILSSLAETAPWPSDHYTATDSVHSAWAGTSMAAPHVTGAAALLFEMDPSLNSSQIKGFLLNSATQDAYTGNAPWHPQWGRGKLNVWAAVETAPVKVQSAASYDFQLSGNFPNPFRRKTCIQYTMKTSGHVLLEIYDLKGRKVKSFLRGHAEPGVHTISWYGRDQVGRNLPSGIYICRMISGEHHQTIKMTLVQ